MPPDAPAAPDYAARWAALKNIPPFLAMVWRASPGLTLAMVALPIYVYLPQFYAGRAGLSLALIGAVLLAARVAAAFTSRIWRRQIRARLPAPGRRVSDAPARQARADWR